jgi:riboflavin biosynthesis pyrimidine reductase
MPAIVAWGTRMIRSAALPPLETLLESTHGRPLPLPPGLLRLYGSLRLAVPRSRPLVFSNFVSSLDAQDRMVMGLLRAAADVVIVGSGTLAADPRTVWTPAAIYPDLAAAYRSLRYAMAKRETALNVVVSAGGAIDLRSPVFASGRVPALIITTPAGARRLSKQRPPESVEIRTVGRSGGKIAPRAILEAALRSNPGKRILIEGGPRLLGSFYKERLVDEQFLTLAPQIVGRDADDGRLSLVMGNTFAPRAPLWGGLVDVRRGGSHLFLRYSFA